MNLRGKLREVMLTKKMKPWKRYVCLLMSFLKNMITIRKAEISDLKVIQEFNNKLCAKEHADFDVTVNPEFARTESGERYFKSSIQNEDRLVLIAEDNNRPIGYIAGGIEKVSEFRTISDMCEIDNMWIDEEYRSQGIGKQLMNKFQNWTREKGIKRIRIIASYENRKGIEFYKREGFNEYDLILEKDL